MTEDTTIEVDTTNPSEDVEIKKENTSPKKKMKMENGSFICSDCGRRYKELASLRSHIIKKCGRERHHCPDCKEVFNTVLVFLKLVSVMMVLVIEMHQK